MALLQTSKATTRSVGNWKISVVWKVTVEVLVQVRKVPSSTACSGLEGRCTSAGLEGRCNSASAGPEGRCRTLEGRLRKGYLRVFECVFLTMCAGSLLVGASKSRESEPAQSFKPALWCSLLGTVSLCSVVGTVMSESLIGTVRMCSLVGTVMCSLVGTVMCSLVGTGICSLVGTVVSGSRTCVARERTHCRSPALASAEIQVDIISWLVLNGLVKDAMRLKQLVCFC